MPRRRYNLNLNCIANIIVKNTNNWVEQQQYHIVNMDY